MIRGAIFDLDGTLLNSNEYWDKAPAVYLAALGKRAGPELAEVIFSMTLPEAADYLTAQYALHQTPRQIMEGVNAAMEGFYRRDVTLKSGVPALLRELNGRGIPCAVASVTDRHLVEAALRRFALHDRFACIVTTAEAGAGKREPAVYLRAARTLGSAPGETLVFEDALHALRTAKRAGFRTVGIYDAHSAEVQEEICAVSDIYLRNFSDLTGILNIL